MYKGGAIVPYGLVRSKVILYKMCRARHSLRTNSMTWAWISLSAMTGSGWKGNTQLNARWRIGGDLVVPIKYFVVVEVVCTLRCECGGVALCGGRWALGAAGRTGLESIVFERSTVST